MIAYWTDRLGYEGREMRCTTPPRGVRITGQPARVFGGGHVAPELGADELLETVDYVLAGHTSEEAGERFGRDGSTIRYRLRAAGYRYDKRTGRWEESR